jgi:hypothetical protein
MWEIHDDIFIKNPISAIFYLHENTIFNVYFVFHVKKHKKTEAMRGGSRGCTPWTASPFGGERGSHSYTLLKKYSKKDGQ